MPQSWPESVSLSLSRRFQPTPSGGRIKQQAAVAPPSDDQGAVRPVGGRTLPPPKGGVDLQTATRVGGFSEALGGVPVASQAVHTEPTTFQNVIRISRSFIISRFCWAACRVWRMWARSLQALMWVNKNAYLQQVLPDLRLAKQARSVSKQQALHYGHVQVR